MTDECYTVKTGVASMGRCYLAAPPMDGRTNYQIGQLEKMSTKPCEHKQHVHAAIIDNKCSSL